MRSEPGHTWGGSTLSGQRLQEPALLGLPMYEAHRSWQLPGQCRAAIIMYAARNRIRRSPALFAVLRGSSLRRAVTPRFAAAFATHAYSTRWRTRFHADGGQCSSVMADTVPR